MSESAESLRIQLDSANARLQNVRRACDAVESVHPSKSQSFHDGVDHALHFVRSALGPT